MAKTAYKRPKFKSEIPMCATEEQVIGWLYAADNKIIRKPACGFCSDCLPDFKEKMLEQGRCENPGIDFRKNRLEGIYGFLR